MICRGWFCQDEVVGDFGGTAGIRLRILDENLDTVDLAARLESAGEVLAQLTQHEGVRLSETRGDRLCDPKSAERRAGGTVPTECSALWNR
jgi:hypothetical protein